MLGPVIEDLAKDNEGKAVKIVKINVEEGRDIAEQFHVSSIPVVFFINHGKVVDHVVGANPKTVYQEKIDALLAENVKMAA